MTEIIYNAMQEVCGCEKKCVVIDHSDNTKSVYCSNIDTGFLFEKIEDKLHNAQITVRVINPKMFNFQKVER